jgi:hypothetical protein
MSVRETSTTIHLRGRIWALGAIALTTPDPVSSPDVRWGGAGLIERGGAMPRKAATLPDLICFGRAGREQLLITTAPGGLVDEALRRAEPLLGDDDVLHLLDWTAFRPLTDTARLHRWALDSYAQAVSAADPRAVVVSLTPAPRTGLWDPKHGELEGFQPLRDNSAMEVWHPTLELA